MGCAMPQPLDVHAAPSLQLCLGLLQAGLGPSCSGTYRQVQRESAGQRQGWDDAPSFCTWHTGRCGICVYLPQLIC